MEICCCVAQASSNERVRSDLTTTYVDMARCANEFDFEKQLSEHSKSRREKIFSIQKMMHKGRPNASDALQQDITLCNTFHVSQYPCFHRVVVGSNNRLK